LANVGYIAGGITNEFSSAVQIKRIAYCVLYTIIVAYRYIQLPDS